MEKSIATYKKGLSLFYLLSLLALLYGCDDLNIEASAEIDNFHVDSIEIRFCYEVNGNVLGKLNPNSTVSLYRSSRTDFNYVMKYVRENRPDEKTSINTSQGFKFECLSPGSYILAIPAISYNKSMGAPLPFEFECQNATLKILYQGGDSSFWVGVFTLNTPANIESITANLSSGYSILGPRFRPCPT